MDTGENLVDTVGRLVDTGGNLVDTRILNNGHGWKF